MADTGWIEAIKAVLPANGEPMHYAQIAAEIAARGLRTSLGATPAQTVSATISVSIRADPDATPFQRSQRGFYCLRDTLPPPTPPDDDGCEAGYINALGIGWRRDQVDWKPTVPNILGRQQSASVIVNFADQRGVYILFDSNRIVYVGRVTEQPLGARLRQHTIDRLNGRWDRFSWFGTRAVRENGELSESDRTKYDGRELIETMEALLIETLGPPLNRRRGDTFASVEFIQERDPELKKQDDAAFLQAVLARMSAK